jgi:hypothetical protein
MNNSIKLVPLAALLSAFFFAGCAAGGGGMVSKRPAKEGMSACPSDRTFVNGECVPIGGAK